MIDIYADFKGFLLNSDKLDAFESSNDTRDKYNYNSVGVIFHLGGRGAARNESKKDPESAMDELMEKFKDTDGDGVADYVDKDNNTPAGVKVYADGTPVDTDGDGVADYLDQEQVSPCKDVDANGVAKDADTDGVADCNDSEPNTAAGAQVDSKGATIVTKAATPGLPTPASNSGEAAPASSGVITGLPSVFFSSNSTTVGYKNYNALTQVAQFMKANPTAKMIVVGNSDKSGTASYNKVLGEKRAQGVVNYLVTRNGIDSSRFTVQSKGSDDPISTRRNSGQDRRVDFLLGQ
jgi:OOP family OmpA-OmpF porin